MDRGFVDLESLEGLGLNCTFYWVPCRLLPDGSGHAPPCSGHAPELYHARTIAGVLAVVLCGD